jgi:hypothetical protein
VACVGSGQHSRAPLSPKPLPEGQTPTITAAALYRPPSSIVAISGPGLRFSWIVYRGNAAAVTFNPDQMKTWTDTRAYANSPWSPPWTIPLPPTDNKWQTRSLSASRTHASRRRERRIPLHLRKRDCDRQPLTTSSSA